MSIDLSASCPDTCGRPGHKDRRRADRRVLLSLLAEVWARFNWWGHADCLMTNHYHLLVETPDGNLFVGLSRSHGRGALPAVAAPGLAALGIQRKLTGGDGGLSPVRLNGHAVNPSLGNSSGITPVARCASSRTSDTSCRGIGMSRKSPARNAGRCPTTRICTQPRRAGHPYLRKLGPIEANRAGLAIILPASAILRCSPSCSCRPCSDARATRPLRHGLPSMFAESPHGQDIRIRR